MRTPRSLLPARIRPAAPTPRSFRRCKRCHRPSYWPSGQEVDKLMSMNRPFGITEQLIEELKAARRGPGLHHPAIETRIGPALRTACGVEPGDLASTVRAKVIDRLRRATDALPDGGGHDRACRARHQPAGARPAPAAGPRRLAGGAAQAGRPDRPPPGGRGLRPAGRRAERLRPARRRRPPARLARAGLRVGGAARRRAPADGRAPADRRRPGRPGPDRARLEPARRSRPGPRRPGALRRGAGRAAAADLDPGQSGPGAAHDPADRRATRILGADVTCRWTCP